MATGTANNAPNGLDPRVLADRKRASAGELRLFLNTAQLLDLNVSQRCAVLGDISEATYHNWRRKPDGVLLTRDQLERISLVLGVVKALRFIFADDDSAFRWLRGENADTPFDGGSPIAKMTAGSILDLFAARQYLEAWRGVR